MRLDLSGSGIVLASLIGFIVWIAALCALGWLWVEMFK